ncbi:MAG: hypothetical protein H6578_10995 [Chitinophagales bacterium]|nr:hypothetical protein [Chitinophagales bacterium]
MKICFLTILTFIIHVHCSGQEIPKVTAELGDTTSYEEVTIPLIGGCSLGCAIGWNMTASSSLESQKGISYDIDNMEDGDPSTAWVEGKNGYGIGEQINITFQGVDTLDILFYEIGLNNGYCKSKETWEANSRVKKAILKKNSEPKLILNFLDSMYPQIFKWDTYYMTVTNGDVVTIEILEVYKGEKYEDTAISDLYLMGAH